MLYRPDSRRPGISLLEVLTAIFIMGIGMLALLTLFPLGALSMARAIRDDRAAAIAANAASTAAAFDLRNDGNVVAELEYNGAGPPAVNYHPPDDNLPSNPVLVDGHYNPALLPAVRPLGELPAFPLPMAGTRTPGIRRAAPAYTRQNGTPEARLTNRWFTLQDEIEFNTLGGAPRAGSASIGRPGTYSYAYLVRRPRYGARELVELSVIVFANRPTDTISGEVTIDVPPPALMGTAGSNTVSFTWAGTKPDVRRGTWLIDVTWTGDLVNGGTLNGHVYRAENVTESGGNTITLELDRALKANVNTIVLMQHAIAVIERGTTWLP
jgi:hypothetical protein